MILIDTDICVGLIRGVEHITNKAKAYKSVVCISFMTYGELCYGAYNSANPLKNLEKLELFVRSVEIIHTNSNILKKFGALKSQMRQSGTLLPDADLLIAATAITTCEKLATGNIKHFDRFAELKLENWFVATAK